MSVHIKDSEDLKAKLEEAGDALVIIDFFATWCGPCNMIAPKFEALPEEFDQMNLVLLKVDVDENEDLTQEYEIASMPTFVFIKNGEVVHKFSGASIDKIKEVILQHQ